MSHTFTAEPVKNDIDKGSKPKISKNLVVIVIVILFLCCIAGALGAAGTYIYLKNKDKDVTDNVNADTSGSEDQDDITADQSDDTEDGSNEDIGDDGISDDSSDDSQGAQDDGNDDGLQLVQQPEASEVFDTMGGVKSYILTASLDEEGSIYAQFQAPDREYVRQTVGTEVVEEIAISDDIYIREDGGTWEKGEDSNLTGFHQDLIDENFWTSDFEIKKKGTSDGYWYYTASSDDSSSFKLYAHKDTKYIYKLEMFSGSYSLGELVFKDYNSDKINIKKPI
ncbi:MAG: hypothetical protein ABIE03_03435 [Patescibacteria group bacterium]|nr:hypothetical protein [Patescibacteria group bacterium]